MRILLIIESLSRGGKERRLLGLLKWIIKQNDVKCELVVMSKDVHYNEVFDFGIKIHYLIRKVKKDLTIFPKLYQICKDFKPDIIHSWGMMTSIYAIPIAKMLNIKFINGQINSAPLQINLFSKEWVGSNFTFLFSDYIISNSYAGLNVYKPPKINSCCIYNGFDFNRIDNSNSKNKIRKKFGITTKKVVGMVANFTDNKDYKTYFEAARKVLNDRIDVSFLAVGDGKYMNYYKEFVNNNEKIIFFGIQKRIEEIINVFNVGVLSTYTEGISNSIIEYMALSKPVVVTNGGGTKELVINEETGFIVNIKSPDEMAEKILFLLDNEKIASRMGKAGRKRIEKHFTLDKMGNKYWNLYNTLIHEHTQ